MKFIAAVALASTLMGPGALELSYPLSSRGTQVTMAWLDRFSDCAIATFRSRRVVNASASANAPADTKFYLDKFIVKSSASGIKGELEVLTGALGNAAAPRSGQVYCIAYAKPTGSAHKVFLNYGADPYIQVIGSGTWQTGIGLFATQVDKVPVGNARTAFLLTVARQFSLIDKEEEASALSEIVRTLGTNEWARLEIGKTDAPTWCAAQFEPTATSMFSKQSSGVQFHILATCSSLPGSKLRRAFFDLRIGLDRKGVRPLTRLGRYRPDVSVDELAVAANASPALRRHLYGCIDEPPSDRSAKLIVGWLTTAPSDFAMEIFGDLARWSGKRDLKPKRAAKADANGLPAILNRDELLKVWRDNPPPMRRKGG